MHAQMGVRPVAGALSNTSFIQKDQLAKNQRSANKAPTRSVGIRQTRPFGVWSNAARQQGRARGS